MVVHEADGGRSQFGTSASEAVTGTDQAETLHGRDGDDVIDGYLGVIRLTVAGAAIRSCSMSLTLPSMVD